MACVLRSQIDDDGNMMNIWSDGKQVNKKAVGNIQNLYQWKTNELGTILAFPGPQEDEKFQMPLDLYLEQIGRSPNDKVFPKFLEDYGQFPKE